jgi:DNA-binding PadR family transcriptional regulator
VLNSYNNYDFCIITLLSRHKKLYNSKIKEMLESDPKINKELSPSTFNYHKRKLEKENIIIALDKDTHRKGQKLFYSLTKSAQDKLKMGILKFGFNNDRDFKIQEKEEVSQQTFYKIYVLLD